MITVESLASRSPRRGRGFPLRPHHDQHLLRQLHPVPPRGLRWAALTGFGIALQFSVFRCALTPLEWLRMRDKLWGLVRLDQDRVVFADLGPEAGRGAESLEIWGQQIEKPLSSSDPLIF